MFNFIKKKKNLASDPADSQKTHRNSSPSSGVKQSLLSLEQRLMFDAAAAATASEVATEQVAQEQAEAAVSGETSHDSTDGEKGGGEDVVQALTNYMPAEKSVEVAFVDPTVPNYQEMLAGMDPNIEVIMLDGGQDGVEQMAEALSGRSGIDAIHLISHGSSGELQLGTGTLNAASMSSDYADEFATIRGALSEQADLLVYGCNFGEGAEGSDAVNLLAELTGADVAASSDATGHIDLGGDWEFEVQAGSIETDLALTDTAQINWAGILRTETISDAFSDKSFGNNDGTRSWSSNWSEVDVGKSDANGGHIKVNSSELRIEAKVAGASVSRGVDLSSARSATLSFDYNNDLDKGGSVEVRISTDGGANYRTLSDGTFSKTSRTGSGTASFDISEHMSADTKIQFLVTGTSGGDRLFIDTVQVDYHVADANAAPTDLALSANTVAENATTGTVVGTVTGTDADAGDSKSYSLTDTAGGRFTIDSATGQLTVADGTLLNYEAARSHTVTVQVTDAGGQSYTESFTINLTNVNEGPTITSNGGGATAAVNVAENETTVTTVAAMDVDSGTTLTYSIAEGADAARFSIDGATGALRFSAAPNFERPSDMGRNNVYNVTVQVSDGQGGTTTQSISVRVTDVNEAPRITSNRGGDVASVTIRENSAAVTKVRATDPDAGTRMTYSVVGGADAALFKINPNTGVLAFNSAPNFEQPADTDHNNVYRVVVQASDGRGGTDSQVISVRVTNVNEAPTDLSLSANSVAENASTGTVVGTVSGTDPDASDTKTYSLTDPAGGRFAINASTGQLTVADGSLLNYKSAASHTVTVRVTDSGGQSYNETFTINLTNVNEGPTDLSLSANSVAENATTGTVVGTVTGTDPDAGDTKTYSLSDTAGGRFAINASTGVITVADGSLLNYESAASHNLTVQVTDSGGQSYTESFTINLTNVNEGPTDLSLSANTVAENAITGTVVGTVSGTDPDAGDTKTYSLTDTAGGRFAINASTGVITVADGSLLNYESAASHNLTVQVTDSGGQSYTESFTINLTNVNEGPTDLSLSANSVAENASTGTVVGTVSGTDPDASDTKTYSLTDTAGGRFAINASTGVITVADGSLLNYEAATSHNLTVQVTDSGGQSYTESFTINLTNVNEGPTDLSLSANSVAENATTGTVVGTVSGTDPDAGDTKSYSLTDTAGGRFAINASTGQLTVADGSLLNYESASSHTVTVRVTDSGGQSYNETFTINLTNVNEGPTDLALSANSVAENASTGTVVGTVTGTDPDASDTKTYSLTDTAGGRFAINASTGVITVADGSLLNYESAASHTLTVQVTDSGGQSYTESFTINLSNVNEGPTDLALSANTVAENATTGTVVGTVSGTDPDAGDTKTYSLTDTADGRFAINASTGVITVADGSLLNYESAASHNLTVQVTDSGGQSYTESFTINLTNVNEGPTDLSLSANSVAENASTGTVVGTVTGTDPDASDTKTYSLTDTAGGRFAIDSATGQLTVADGSLLNYEAAASHTVTVRITDSGGQSHTETFTINLANVNEASWEDVDHRLTTANFGIRDSNASPNASLPGINLSNESEEDRFRLPDNPRNVIEIKTEGPLPIEIITPGHTGPSVISTPVEKALAAHKAERLPNRGEKRGPDATGDQTDIQNTAAAEAERKEFLKPDDPIENVEESAALKLSATIGLAGVVLQNSLENTTKLSRLISRPARASNIPPNTTTQQSSPDDHASNQDKSEHPRSAAEDADQT